jgi:hypothetical protein
LVITSRWSRTSEMGWPRAAIADTNRTGAETAAAGEASARNTAGLMRSMRSIATAA